MEEGVLSVFLQGWFTAAMNYDFWLVTVDLSIQMLRPAVECDLIATGELVKSGKKMACLLYTSPSPRDQRGSRMPSSA